MIPAIPDDRRKAEDAIRRAEEKAYRAFCGGISILHQTMPKAIGTTKEEGQEGIERALRRLLVEFIKAKP